MCDYAVLLLAAKLYIATSTRDTSIDTVCTPCSCPIDDFNASCLEYQAAIARERQSELDKIRDVVAQCETESVVN